MLNQHLLSTLALLLTAAVSGSACGPDPPSTGGDAYPGGTLRIIVPFSPGGTYDLHSRILARHIGAHLPGNPPVVVENMAGAGGMIAARHIMHRAPADGSTLGMMSPAAALVSFLGKDHAGVDVSRLGIIGSMVVDVPVCVFARSAGIGNVETWRHADQSPKIGMTGAGALSHAFSMLITAALELPIRPVAGYRGMSEIRHALEGGEVDGVCMGLASFESTFVPNSDYVVALQAGARRAVGLEETDLAIDLAEGRQRQSLANLLMLVSASGRYYAVPPETPAHLLDIVSRAFEATMRDPRFRDAAAAARIDINWRSQREVVESVNAMLAIPKDVQRLMSEALSPDRTFGAWGAR